MSVTITEAQAIEWLRERDRFLILTHSRPDGDTLGCASALCLSLQKIGKSAWIAPNPELSDFLAPCFDLPFAPADYVPEHVVAVDLAAEPMFPVTDRPELLEHVELCIDHHESNSRYAELLCLDPSAAAAAEVLYRICTALTELDEPIARALYVGIATDCGCFAYANTTAETHRIAAELLRHVNVKGLNKHLFQTRSFKELKLEAVLLQSEAFFEDGKICIGTVTMADKARVGATEDDCESLAGYASAIEGVRCAATLREKQPRRWKLSVRCDADYLNGSDVCALLGGGGHAAAAGATIVEPMDEAQARARVKACIDAVLRGEVG